jgi:hypothetical protein
MRVSPSSSIIATDGHQRTWTNGLHWKYENLAVYDRRCNVVAPASHTGNRVPHWRRAHMGAESPTSSYTGTESSRYPTANSLISFEYSSTTPCSLLGNSLYHYSLTPINKAIRVLALLLPTAFFSSINRGVASETIVTDDLRHTFLQMSRGLAFILLVVSVYAICLVM